jgi:hypothetical protein
MVHTRFWLMPKMLINLEEYVHTVKENAEASVAATKEIRIEGNTEKKPRCFFLRMKRIEDVELHRSPLWATYTCGRKQHIN